ncbi:unnamed protein product [Clonostachys rhizophaga]|uniref:Zn(2)-C6 fungal-type domain-containing protein n=1 Tax=Clonostachys rhizophaga TaxID=160324 RepID=A0A9N9YSR3_9HYPO|nr:unnamed protein product [Clonostachys rhizophaga]
MPRRSTLRTACRACRACRTKCDSRLRCARCKEKQLDCIYENVGVVSKASLRAEIQDLKGRLEEADTLLDALLNALKTGSKQTGIRDFADTIIRGLDRRDTRGAIVKLLNFVDEADKAVYPSPATVSTVDPDSAIEISDVDSTSSSKGSSYPTLLSRPATRRIDSDDTCVVASTSSKTPCSSTATSTSRLPCSFPAPLSSVEAVEPTFTLPGVESSCSQLDIWTSSGWTKPYTLSLITAVLEWDALPLCLVNKALLLRDFESGARQYCSSALVNALLAIAARLVEESQKRDSVQLDLSLCASETFVRESSAHLHSEGPIVDTLPNIQAIGVLALYEASFGQEARAAKLADEYASAIADLCFSEPTPQPGSDYNQVRADTYRGAISLRRYALLN